MNDRYIENTINNIKRERLLSLTNIFVMMLSFLFLGIFIIVVAVTQTVLTNLGQQAQVTIFFKDDFTEDKILGVQSKLKEDARILSVNYISKEQAYVIFKEINKDDPVLLESASSSILPASLEIKAKELADLPKLNNEFAAVEGVEEVRFFEEVINKFRGFSTIAYVIGFGLVFLFFVISYAIVLSTLRATISSKGPELEILKIVGATDAYVKMPLIYQGVFYGFSSAFLAGGLLVIITLILNVYQIIPQGFKFGFIPGVVVNNIGFSFMLWFILFLSGLLLGFLGSTLAIRRYLRY